MLQYLGDIFLTASVLVLGGVGIWYFRFRPRQTGGLPDSRAGLAAAIVHQKAAASMAMQGEPAQPPAELTGATVAIALETILDELGLETLEELGEQEVPAGKHQGDSFQATLEDSAFCKWICKEPRKGWMGLLKTYIEAVEERRAIAEPLPSQEVGADSPQPSGTPSIAAAGTEKTSGAISRKPR